MVACRVRGGSTTKGRGRRQASAVTATWYVQFKALLNTQRLYAQLLVQVRGVPGTAVYDYPPLGSVMSFGALIGGQPTIAFSQDGLTNWQMMVKLIPRGLLITPRRNALFCRERQCITLSLRAGIAPTTHTSYWATGLLTVR
jgi:hypothetical protein